MPSRWLSWEYLLIWHPIFWGGWCLVSYWGVQTCDVFNTVEVMNPHQLQAARLSRKPFLVRMKHSWLLPWRLQDYSDIQWTTFTGFFPTILVPGMIVFLIASHLFRRQLVDAAPAVRARGMAWFYTAVGCGILVYLHRAWTLFFLVPVFINYAMARAVAGRRGAPLLFWAVNVALLFAIDRFDGFKFKLVGQWIGVSSLSVLDDLSAGHVMKWHVTYNVGMCRLLSYCMDYHWAAVQKPLVEGLKDRSVALQRAQHHHDLEEYASLPALMAYVTYFPLYTAGPIVTFNSFYSQLKVPQTEVATQQIVRMFVACACYLLMIEFLLHYVYYHTMSELDLWKGLPPHEIAIMAFWTLIFMYHKFLIIWRFFRVWALADGIASPENMLRCVLNNYTFEGFWRAWHGSLNKWIVRYLYVPLGGASTQYLSIWLIFGFIGMWHDLIWKWQAWALLNCVFFSMEIVVRRFVSTPRFDAVWAAWFSRHVAAMVAVCNIFLLMCANLAILYGFDGTPHFLARLILEEGGGRTMLFAFVWVMSGVHYMFEIRAGEARANKIKKF